MRSMKSLRQKSMTKTGSPIKFIFATALGLTTLVVMLGSTVMLVQAENNNADIARVRIEINGDPIVQSLRSVSGGDLIFGLLESFSAGSQTPSLELATVSLSDIVIQTTVNNNDGDMSTSRVALNSTFSVEIRENSSLNSAVSSIDVGDANINFVNAANTSDTVFNFSTIADHTFGELQITVQRSGSIDNEMWDWVSTYIAGTPEKFDVTITALDPNLVTEVRSWVFRDCLLSGFTPRTEDDPNNMSITIQPGRLEFEAQGEITKLTSPFTKVFEGDQVTPMQITVIEQDSNLVDLSSTTYEESLPSRYVFPKFDARSAGHMLEEFHFKPTILVHD